MPPIQPRVPNLDFEPRWRVLEVDSDVDGDPNTREVTSVLPVRTKGLLVRVTSYGLKKHEIVSESMVFAPGAMVARQIGKTTKHLYGEIIAGDAGSPGTVIDRLVSEKPEVTQGWKAANESFKEVEVVPKKRGEEITFRDPTDEERWEQYLKWLENQPEE